MPFHYIIYKPSGIYLKKDGISTLFKQYFFNEKKFVRFLYYNYKT